MGNGGYAVFRLRPEARQGNELTAREEHEVLAKPDTWKEYMRVCEAEQGADCGARLMESAATWHHSMKRPEVANTLRKLAQKRFPGDAYVNYYWGRYADYDAQDSSARTGELYEQAIRTNQDNTIMLKEYLMWLDMV